MSSQPGESLVQHKGCPLYLISDKRQLRIVAWPGWGGGDVMGDGGGPGTVSNVDQSRQPTPGEQVVRGGRILHPG